jgi:hypothetical protein
MQKKPKSNTVFKRHIEESYNKNIKENNGLKTIIID